MVDLSRFLRHGTVITETGSDEWRTPKAIFDVLHKRHKFTIDAAASKHNSLCSRYWDERDDALEMDWKNERVFCNPPYSKVAAFLFKAQTAALSVFLIPMRPQTTFFLNYVWASPYLHEMMIIHRGIRFLHPEGKVAVRSPMPCCVLLYRNTEREGDLFISVNCADTLAPLTIVAGARRGRPMQHGATLKDKIIQDYQKGIKVAELVGKYGVSKSTIYRWIA